MIRGFTIIETLIAFAVIAIIATLGITHIGALNERKALSLEAEKVLSLLGRARAETLAGRDGLAYGVHLEATKAVLFSGTIYSVGATGNEEQTLNSAVKIAAIALADGGSEVRFKKLTGATGGSGTVTLALVSGGSSTAVITVAATGLASRN